MIRGIYTATAGMLANQRKQDILTHNLANLDTPGYKADKTVMKSFPDLLQMRIRDGVPTPVGRLTQGVYLQEAIPDFKQGVIVETMQPLDIAIQDPEVAGTILFTVMDGDGNQHYVRNGTFQIDDAGQVRTAEGDWLLDANGQPITVGNERFRVSASGLVTSENGITQQIGLAQIDNPLDLIKEGNNRYRLEENQPPLLANPPAVLRQGFVEKSNVDPAQTMLEMMSASRMFEANQRVIRAIDDTLKKAVSEVGVVK